MRELEFTTENSAGIEQKVLPTFGVLVARGGGARRPLGSFDWARLVHAEQAFELHRPLPAGAVFQTAKQDGTVVIDRGRVRVRDAG